MQMWSERRPCICGATSNTTHWYMCTVYGLYDEQGNALYSTSIKAKENTPMFDQQFTRKTFSVEAIRITQENIRDVCQKIGGTMGYQAPGAGIPDTGDYIKMTRVSSPLSDRQKKAFVGDWVTYAKKSFKVYQDKSFRGTFLVKPEEPAEVPIETPSFDRNKHNHEIDENCGASCKVWRAQQSWATGETIFTPVLADERGPEGYAPGDLVDVVEEQSPTPPQGGAINS